MNRQGPIWPGIISILAPLIQLVVVISVSLSNLLNFKDFFMYPQILTLVNFLILFLILSGIGIYWYWRNSFSLFYKQKSPKKIVQKKSNEQKDSGNINFNNDYNATSKTNLEFIPPEQKIFKLIKSLLITTIILFLIFLSISMLIYFKKFVFPEVLIIIPQYVCYSLLLVFNGIILYIWIYEYIQKKQAFKPEHLIPNLINSLQNNGFMEPLKMSIWENIMFTNGIDRKIELELGKKKYVIISNFDGSEIKKVYIKDEYDKLYPR